MLAIVLSRSACASSAAASAASSLASLAFALTPFGLGLGVLFHPTMLDVPIWAGFLYVALQDPRPSRAAPAARARADRRGRPRDEGRPCWPCSRSSRCRSPSLGPRSLLRDRRAWLGAGIARGLRAAVHRLADRARLAEPRVPREPGLEDRRGHVARRLRRPAARVPRGSAPARRGRRRDALASPAAARPRRPGARRQPGLPRRAGTQLLRASCRRAAARGRRRDGGTLACAARARGSRSSLRSWRCTSSRSRSWRRWSGRCCRSGRWSSAASGTTASTRTRSAGPSWSRQTAGAWRAIPAARAAGDGAAGAELRRGRRARPVRPARRAAPAAQRSSLVPVLAAGEPAATTRPGGRLRPSDLDRLCTAWRVVARIDNRWQIDNEERGRPIARCALRGTLGELWSSEIATDRL